MKQLVEVVMLPTEDKTNTVRNTYCFTKEHGNPLRFVPNLDNQNELVERGFEFQHLYITIPSDVETIKEDDWCYNIVGNTIGKAGKNSTEHDIKTNRKIIATTDTKLKVTDPNHPNVLPDWSLPQVQQSFLKEFVANPDGKWEVEYDEISKFDVFNMETEESVTLSTMYELKVNPDNTVNITSVEEKMYSREEVEKLIKIAFNDFRQKGKSVQYIVGGGNPNPNGTKRKYIVTDVYNWIKENL
jgi:hypothetical protein